jgi:glycerophosphoryl diester phosphodiesterase
MRNFFHGLCLGLLLASSFPAAIAQEIVAHRGASYDAPENTLAAFELAWEQNADAVEGDFFLTADGHIVCIHDKDTARVSPLAGKMIVAQSQLEQLRGLDVGSWKAPIFSAQRVPTLEEVLAVVPAGKRIFIEIKCGPEILPELEKQLAASRLRPEQVMLIAFDAEVVRQARIRMPQYKANWLVGYKQEDEAGPWKPGIDEVLATLKATGATGLGTQGNAEVVDQAFAAAIKDAGYELHVWTVNEPQAAEYWQGLGVDSITTDRPEYLRDHLGWLHCQAVELILPSELDAVEQNLAELLRQLLERLGVAVTQTQDGSSPPSVGESNQLDSKRLRIYWGRFDRHPSLAELARQNGIAPPDQIDPGPEGYRLTMLPKGADSQPNGRALLVVASDRRGLLYAIGELFRQAVRLPDGIRLAGDLDVRGVARWPIRGNITHQGHTITELTGSRKWTVEETQRAIVEYALAGANTFELNQVGSDDPTYRFIKSLGLDTMVVIVANVGSGPDEWQAVEAIGRKGYLCPSIPEARQALVQQHTARIQRMAPFDYVHWKSGDGGGCECDRCRPYGRPFVALCEELTDVLHRFHPQTHAFVGNQKLDNAGDQAILRHLQQRSESRIEGIVFGPGSNAMGWMPGRRQDHRVDLFPYSGMGQVDGYLRHLLHELPPERHLLLFSDLTHWVYSQYGLMDHHLIADRDGHLPPVWDRWMVDQRPDPAMQQVYNRRTFHARPRAYHRIFQHVMRFGLGDVAYSEGHHDHFNQWMWQRLMWDPHQSVEDAVLAYCQYHFGPQAASTMREAILLHEQNLSTSITENPGIDRFIELVELAGRQIPKEYGDENYLWLQYLQRGLIDKCIQIQLAAQKSLEHRVLKLLEEGLSQSRGEEASEKVDQAELGAGETPALAEALNEAAQLLQRPLQTPELQDLRERADQLGQQSDALYGVRNEGLFNLDQDYVGLGWLLREVHRAMEQPRTKQRELVQRIVHYEDPGPGGFYDDLGHPDRSPHLVHGWPFGDGEFSDSNRPSQRRMAFTTDGQAGVTLRYQKLNPNASYRVRMTLVRPSYKERFARWHRQTGQSIYADDFVLAENLELPEHEADFFEFDIPVAATSDGELQLRFEKQPGIGEGPESQLTVWRNTGGWGTLVSEVWLMVVPTP